MAIFLTSRWPHSKPMMRAQARTAVAGGGSDSSELGRESAIDRALRRWLPVPRASLILWLQELALLQRSGIDLVRGMSLLLEHETHPRFQYIGRQVLVAVGAHGATLSQACRMYPSIYPSSVVLMLEAGEHGGDLSGCLERSADMLRSHHSLVQRIGQVLTPPLMTIACCILLMGGAAKVVLPRLLDLLAGLHARPSAATSLLTGLVHFVNGPWVVGTSLAVGTFVVLYWRVLQETLSNWLFTSRLTSRLTGQILAVTFCDLVGRLYAQGVPLLRVLDMVAQNTTHRLYQQQLAQARLDFLRGEPLSAAIRSVPSFPRVVSEMLKVGEETGALDQTLQSVSRLLDEGTQDLLARLTTLLEPAVLIGTGVMVLLCLVGVLMPLYQMLDAVQ